MSKTLLWVIVIGILVALVGGFFLFSSPDDSNVNEGISVVDTSNSQATQETDDGSATDTSTTDSSTSQDTVPVQETKEFDITAKQWTFSPNPITVNQGDKVILNIHSIDVSHGFVLSAFGISERLSPGNTVKVEFTADKKGSFSFFCNVVCGTGHSGMNGILIVN